MRHLSSDGLYVFQSRPPRENGEEPTVTKVNGRTITSEEEQDTITRANAENRRREASMLTGLLR